jgi:hypothetical protein
MVVESNPLSGARGERNTLGSRASTVLAFAPVALLVTLITHAVHVRAILGRWPVVYRDSPQSLLLSAHEQALLLPLVYVVLFGTPVWVVASALRLKRGHTSTGRVAREAGCNLAASATIVVLAAADGTGYVDWLLD